MPEDPTTLETFGTIVNEKLQEFATVGIAVLTVAIGIGLAFWGIRRLVRLGKSSI